MNKLKQPAVLLRLGFICILLWWVPFWALAPEISKTIGFDNVALMTTIIMVIQTVIGVIGFLLVGKPVAAVVKQASFKKAPGIIFYAIVHGKLKEQV